MDPVPLKYLPCDAPWPPSAGSRAIKPAEWVPEMMLAGKIVVYANFWRSKEKVVEFVDRGCGAGQIVCWACDGTGVYEGAPEPMQCGRCNGSGKEYVSI